MTSFLRTRKDRHPKHDKPRLPQEHEPQAARQASNDSRAGQDGSGNGPEQLSRAAAATRKEPGGS